MEIIQLPNRVVFLYEDMHNFRVIHTDGRGHRPTWEPSLMGDSVGWWDGESLVIDTVGLADRTWLDSLGNRHSDVLHVIERWRRISATEVWYEATIDDPTFYTEPWTTGWVLPLAPPDREIMEFACSDNNTDMEDGHLRPGALDGLGPASVSRLRAPIIRWCTMRASRAGLRNRSPRPGGGCRSGTRLVRAWNGSGVRNCAVSTRNGRLPCCAARQTTPFRHARPARRQA